MGLHHQWFTASPWFTCLDLYFSCWDHHREKQQLARCYPLGIKQGEENSNFFWLFYSYFRITKHLFIGAFPASLDYQLQFRPSSRQTLPNVRGGACFLALKHAGFVLKARILKYIDSNYIHACNHYFGMGHAIFDFPLLLCESQGAGGFDP